MSSREIRGDCQAATDSTDAIVAALHGRRFDPAKPNRSEAVLAAALGARLLASDVSNEARWVALALLLGRVPSAAAGSSFELRDATVADRLHEDARLGPGRRDLIDLRIVKATEIGKRTARYKFEAQDPRPGAFSLSIREGGLGRLARDHSLGRWHVIAYAAICRIFHDARNPAGGPDVAVIRRVIHEQIGDVVGCAPEDAECLLGDLVHADAVGFLAWSLNSPPAKAEAAKEATGG